MMTIVIESAAFSQESAAWDVHACITNSTGSFCGPFVVALPESATVAEISAACEAMADPAI